MVESSEGLRRESRLSEILVLSGGAAQGAVGAAAALEGLTIRGDFGAVGAMQKKLLDGEPCDLVILTRKIVEELTAAGRVVASGDLGAVPTAIAVRAQDEPPLVSDSRELREALLAADEIYFPDPQKATAGIHFAKVLDQLGVRGNRRTFPNGATAMREMTRSRAKRVIGCTQATEILNTEGAKLVEALPAPFDLVTTYTAGVCAGAPHREAAQRFLALLTSEASRTLRRKAGFQV